MGAPATLPEQVVATLLAAALSLTVGSTIFSGPEQIGVDTGIPAAAVFCATYGGTPPIPFLGTATDVRSIAVQATIRGETGDHDGARARAWTAWQALQRITAPAAGYIDVMCQQSAPVYIGLNEVGQPRFTVNVYLRYEG